MFVRTYCGAGGRKISCCARQRSALRSFWASFWPFIRSRPPIPNAPLPEAEAPYTLENVYGLEGEYSAYETDGSFFVPVQANYASSRETFLGRSRFLSVEMAGCRWEWVARRVFDAYTGEGETRPELAEALGVDALSLSVVSAGGGLLPLDVAISSETVEWLLALVENTSYPYAPAPVLPRRPERGAHLGGAL